MLTTLEMVSMAMVLVLLMYHVKGCLATVATGYFGLILQLSHSKAAAWQPKYKYSINLE